MSQPIRQASAERQARKLLVAYLTSRARVERLLEWFGQLSWELGESESAPLGLRELANEVQLSLDGAAVEQSIARSAFDLLACCRDVGWHTLRSDVVPITVERPRGSG